MREPGSGGEKGADEGAAVSAEETSAQPPRSVSLCGSKRKREVLRWTAAEELLLQESLAQFGEKAWMKVAAAVQTRTARQCKEHYREVLRYVCFNEEI